MPTLAKDIFSDNYLKSALLLLNCNVRIKFIAADQQERLLLWLFSALGEAVRHHEQLLPIPCRCQVERESAAQPYAWESPGGHSVHLASSDGTQPLRRHKRKRLWLGIPSV